LPSKHIIFATHGKDEQYQKNSFPITVDNRTEAFFQDYILSKGINPKTEFVTVVKGDQHRYAETEAKNFRYVSIPSIADPSDWQEVNFGTSKSGIVLELFYPNESDPWRKVIRF
jgi:hypothetical protein